MRTHLVSTMVGVVLAIALVAWIGPNAGGTAFVVTVTLVVVNGIGALVARARSGGLRGNSS